MLSQLERIERRFLELESLLAHPSTMNRPDEYRKLSKERADLEETVSLTRSYRKLQKELQDAQELLASADDEMKALVYDEVDSLKIQLQNLENELTIQLLPKDKNDNKNVFLEIRAGAGGDEASLFAGQLFRMYSRFADKRGWRTTIMSISENEVGGYKEIIAFIEGHSIYQTLKYESGVHRVQRVPQTEAQGRVHTSTVTVAILPEADEMEEVKINEQDLRVDTYRAGGAGGQHVNRTDSAVRLTHLPSGIVVTCQDERSQIKNRSKAMKILQAKLAEIAQIEQEKAWSDERRSQVGKGDRSERIRTYNFPQSRITDHRINHTIHSIDAFMEGDIQEMIELLIKHQRSEAIKNFNNHSV